MSARLALLLVLGPFPLTWGAGLVGGADDVKLNPQLEKDLQPRLVTLDQKALPLNKALQALRDQTGIEVRLEADESPTLKNLKLDKVPFWKALDAIAKSADMRVSLYGKDNKLALVQDERGYREMLTSYSGLFRVVLKRVVMIRDLDTDAHYGVARLEVAWEPRFQAFLLETVPESYEIRDENGVVLEAPAIARGQTPADGRVSVEIDVPLPAFRRATPRIGSITGELSMIGSPKLLTFTFDKLPAREEKTQEGVSVQLQQFKVGKELWTADFMLKYPPGGPKFESFQSWLVNNQCYLVSAAGKRLENAGYETDDQAGTTATLRYRFTDDDEKQVKLGKPGDWQLVYRTPGQIAEVGIKFSFKNVPLP